MSSRLAALKHLVCGRRRSPRAFTRADGYSPDDLLHFARDHLASAKVLSERSFECYDSAGHLSHLGIELMLKALLLYAAGEFPATHDLSALLRGIAAEYPELDLCTADKELI